MRIVPNNVIFMMLTIGFTAVLL
ncbi:MAG: hypothetical protein RLZZ526_506, partial [Actinomycetota bacterium]